MEEPKSKSQKKREAAYLQEIGMKLVELSMDKLDMLPLPVNLRHAIIEAKSIRSHGAARRQAQLIGKFMRAADSEAIIDAYQALLAEGNAQTATFHELEEWRNRLMSGDNEALTEFIALFQPSDVQKLRHLIKKAIEEKKANQNHGAAKMLFRFLRECL